MRGETPRRRRASPPAAAAERVVEGVARARARPAPARRGVQRHVRHARLGGRRRGRRRGGRRRTRRHHRRGYRRLRGRVRGPRPAEGVGPEGRGIPPRRGVLGRHRRRLPLGRREDVVERRGGGRGAHRGEHRAGGEALGRQVLAERGQAPARHPLGRSHHVGAAAGPRHAHQGAVPARRSRRRRRVDRPPGGPVVRAAVPRVCPRPRRVVRRSPQRGERAVVRRRHELVPAAALGERPEESAAAHGQARVARVGGLRDGQRPRVELPLAGVRPGQALEAARLELLEPPLAVEAGVPRRHLGHLRGDPRHAAPEEAVLLVRQRGVELAHLDEQREQVLPPPLQHLLEEGAEIVHEAVVLLPGLDELLLVPPQLVHALLLDALPLGHGLVVRLVDVLDLPAVVVEVDAQLVVLLQVAGDPRRQDPLPLRRVRDDVLGVLGPVRLVLLVQAQVDRRVRRRRRVRPRPPAAAPAVVRRAAVGRPYGVARDVPRALEQGRVDRQRVHGLGHLEAAAGVSPHGLEVAVERRDEELEVLRELAVPDAEVAELLGPVLRLGDARLVLHAGRYAVFLHHRCGVRRATAECGMRLSRCVDCVVRL
mmetsp:Transcript_38565/g.86915  ORF Transcript_38565/g.86915 Transcript_38565/m.86915 type:complete len:596 (-) Transcript_38565:176-1963(-)